MENPISIKRFINMKLSQIKTDKSDAKMICAYAESEGPKLWTGQFKLQITCLQMIRLVSVYFKQTTALKNKIQGEQALGNPCMDVVRSLNRSLEYLQKEI